MNKNKKIRSTGTARRKFTGFTGTHLKWFALICMCIDHAGAVLLENGLLPKITSSVLVGNSYDYLTNDYLFWYNLSIVCRLIGRLAFPLYCFLLVEGFLHTKSVTRYALRLGIFALLSELPFDLALYGTILDLQHQNVFFTLLFGLLVLYGMDYMEIKHPPHRLLPYLVIFGGMLVSSFLQTDYNAFGILLIVMLYLLRENRRTQCITGALCTIWEYSAPLAFIPIRFYNGERGKQKCKYFYYLFYPLHLLLLFVLHSALF